MELCGWVRSVCVCLYARAIIRLSLLMFNRFDFFPLSQFTSTHLTPTGLPFCFHLSQSQHGAIGVWPMHMQRTIEILSMHFVIIVKHISNSNKKKIPRLPISISMFVVFFFLMSRFCYVNGSFPHRESQVLYY